MNCWLILKKTETPMPNYTVAADLDNILAEHIAAELSAESGSTPDDSILDYYLDAAESVVDSYLAKRYNVPLSVTPIPAAVKDAVLVIARYRLYIRREYVTEEVRKDYEDMLEWLKMVATGELDLPVDETGGEIDEVASSGFSTSDHDDMVFDSNIFN